MTGKGFVVGSGHGVILRYSAGIRLKVLRKTTENLSQDSLSLGPRIEPGTSRIRRSVNHQPRRPVIFGYFSLSKCVEQRTSGSVR
jgi:hypothetical protein